MTFIRKQAPLIWVGAMLLIFLGERFAADESLLRWFLTTPGYLVAGAVVLARFLDWKQVEGMAQKAAFLPFVGYTVAFIALLLYPLSTFGVVDRFDFSEDGSQRWMVFWSVAWLVPWFLGTGLGLASDWARIGTVRSDRIEVSRVQGSAMSVVTLFLAISWIVAVNYVASQHDHVWEWSTKTRVKPSEGARALAQGLSEDVEIILFFPPASDVLLRIEPYFKEIADLSALISVRTVDHAMEPSLAKELGARNNGLIFIRRGGDKQRIDLGVTYSKARRKLSSLDQNVQEALLKVGRTRQTVYFSVGHDELKDVTGETGRPAIRNAKNLLKAINVTTNNLSAADLVSGIPSDAGTIIIAGPQTMFLPEEVEALRSWYAAGGSLFLLIDPDVDVGLTPLLEDLGMAIPAGTAANSRHHIKRENGLTDRALVYSNRFGSHPVVADLSRLASNLFLGFEGAGALHDIEGAVAKTQVLVRPMPGTWLETSGDFEQQRDTERDENKALIRASTTGEGDHESRAVVIADSDFIGNRFIMLSANSMTPNAKFLLDSWLWLSRSTDAEVKIVPGDDDPVIQHTRDQDTLWFYLTVMGVPLFVLLGGIIYVRRRKGGQA